MKKQYKQKEFRTDRLKLSQLDSVNLEDLHKLRSNNEIVKYVDKSIDQSIEETQQFIEKINEGVQEQSWYYWSIIQTDKLVLIGTICLWAFDKNKTSAEIGFELHPAYQGMGVMTEAIQPIIDFAFKNLGLKQITGFTHRENSASHKLLKKNKFYELGTEDNNIIFALDNPNIVS